MNKHPMIGAAEAIKRITNADVTVIDVRSEAEYEKAHFGNTINIPILSDPHRHQVGLTYKQLGSEQAKTLGHQLVSGDYKQLMIERWLDAIAERPQQPALLFCWRGGLRSRLAQEWISQNGSDVIRIEGGYKSLRHEALRTLENPKPFIVLSGMTGAGKTRLLHELRRYVDIEGIACHRGSAFGLPFGASQPQQATFENILAQAFIEAGNHYVLEDESPNIGRCHLPDHLYAEMAKAPMVVIDTPIRSRAMEIHEEYIQAPLANGLSSSLLENRFLDNMEKIRNRLGGLECDNIKTMLTKAFAASAIDKENDHLHLDWIERLLEVYYDKRYLYSLSRKSRQTLFKGSWPECLEFLRQLQNA
ncbi:MAG: tRNA 2-selenouridine(34) synthase MnmH [Gammaproteobacteria bacterium]